MNRIWFDTEFIDDGHTIDLISIGMVRTDGVGLYCENGECHMDRASDWVRQNVFPHLTKGDNLMSRREIAKAVRGFVGPDPEFWAYYASYDWVALCQLYGTMMDLPEGWPKFCLDIKQVAYLAGSPSLQRPEGGDHHALADAQWNKRIWHELMRQKEFN
jgi:hypothetical protein